MATGPVMPCRPVPIIMIGGDVVFHVRRIKMKGLDHLAGVVPVSYTHLTLPTKA